MFFMQNQGKKFFDPNLGFWVIFLPTATPGCGGGGGGSKIFFYWSPAFRICTGCLAKYELNLIKIGLKNTYVQVFQGFPALKETCAHLQPNGHFDQFLAKMAKTVKIIKKALGTFFSHLQALTNCKVSEKSNERFQRKRVTHVRTHARTYVRTRLLRSPTTSSIDQK